MDPPIVNTYQNHPDTSSVAVRTSPPGSSESSPVQTMIPPPPNPFAIAPASHTPRLSGPLPQIGSRSPGGYNNSVPYNNYGALSTSPSTASGSLQEAQMNDNPSFSTAGISPTQMSAATLNAQKRAYRQRRKDPSCDACRERKVKCDATETTACSECSSRNHKCQFTKETNRRMSSIKQVQDLQSQLAELRQENSHLRTKVTDQVTAPRAARNRHTDNHGSLQPVPHIVESSQTAQAPRRIPAPEMSNFDSVRKNIRAYSRGIFDLPSQSQRSSTPTTVESDFPEMPIRSDFAHLSRAYLDSIHESFPILHWPTFQHEVDQIYTARSFEGTSREWIGLFFAVLACGTLQTPTNSPGLLRGANNGIMYFEIATHAVTPWPHELMITHAKASLLLSIFANESNMKSAGSILLASAARIAQSLGLNSETESWPVVDGEMRRRLWWSIYAWDRIASLQTNCPMLINEDDCDVSMPSSLEDRYIQSHPHVSQPPFTGFLAVIQVARLFSPLYQTLKSSTITPQTLQSYDEKLHSKLSLFPESYQPTSDVQLEPAALYPLLVLQLARFCLYRRNLSPVCRPAERSDALRRCTAVAQDTAKYISRTLHGPPGKQVSEKSWQTRVTQLASNTICIHLWRCILILCFRTDYEAALMCLHMSIAIGDLRKINTACGKNITFFLERLMDRVRSGNGGHHQLEHDEEMLAYASGDLQGSLEHSWVWAGASGFASGPTSPYTSPGSGNHVRDTDEHMQGTNLPLRPSNAHLENGTRDWDGWGRVEQMMHQLMEEHRARLAQPPSYYPPPHNPVKRVQLAPDAPGSPNKTLAMSPPSQSSTSRISIANII